MEEDHSQDRTAGQQLQVKPGWLAMMFRSLVVHRVMMATAELILEELTKDYPAHYSMMDKLECIVFWDWLDFLELTDL